MNRAIWLSNIPADLTPDELPDVAFRIEVTLDDEIRPAWLAAGRPGSIAEAFGMTDAFFARWYFGRVTDAELVAWWRATRRPLGRPSLLRVPRAP